MNLFGKAFLVFSLVFISQQSFASELDGDQAKSGFCAKSGSDKAIDGIPKTILGIIDGLPKTVSEKCTPPPSFHTMRPLVQAYMKEQEECAGKASTARMMCIESCSPHLATILPMVNTLIGALRMGGVVEACSKMNNAMNLVQTGLTAYSGACGATKMMCDTSCGKAAATLKKIVALAEKVPQEATLCPENSTAYTKASSAILQQTSQDENGSEPMAVASKVTTCKGYAISLASAGMGIVQALTSAKQAQACDDKVQAAEIPSGKLDCSKPENEAMPTCICEKNPRATGCAGEVVGRPSDFGGTTASTNGTTDTGKLSLTSPGGKSTPDGTPKGDVGGGGGAAAPVGGGGGNLDGSGGSGDAKKEQAVIKKMNTNLYGGEGGGGGGGAFGRSGGGSPESLAKDAKFLKQREVAATREQVTPPQGKSNWEKVSERYTTQKSTLIGQ